MKLDRVLLFCFIVFTVISCGSKKKVVTTKERVQKEEPVKPSIADNPSEPSTEQPNSYIYTIEEYIKEFAPIAQEEMRLYRIPASITLAQGILESGGGKGDLTRRANNHFGIKCHDWKGEKVYHDDDERGECFRKYRHAKYSYRDHSLFLSGRGRYASLFDLDPDDYVGWAEGLREAGYATDRKYPDKLIGLIERYELYKYDAEILTGSAPKYSSVQEKKSEKHIVKKGDTLYSIAKYYNTTVEDLKRANKLDGNNISIGQVLKIK